MGGLGVGGGGRFKWVGNYRGRSEGTGSVEGSRVKVDEIGELWAQLFGSNHLRAVFKEEWGGGSIIENIWDRLRVSGGGGEG